MNRLRTFFQRRFVLECAFLFTISASLLGAERQYPATGLILKIDQPHKSVVVSCNAIPGYMEAMTMPLSVRNEKELQGLKPGTMVDFVLVVDQNSVFAESVRTHFYQGLEPDPAAARRLKLLTKASKNSVKPLTIGDAVPDFTLTGQDGMPVTFSQFHGKVIALNFVYTRCALPNFCVRSSNNFGNLQKRFRNHLKRDLVLLTVTFDPVHDSPNALSKYARTWKADPHAWHFLTGSEATIRRVCDLFGEDYFPDEGLMDHSLHTAIIDRRGRLIANLEGNEFTAEQLGDLVQTVLTGSFSVSSR
jgi:protein SCO1